MFNCIIVFEEVREDMQVVGVTKEDAEEDRVVTWRLASDLL